MRARVFALASLVVYAVGGIARAEAPTDWAQCAGRLEQAKAELVALHPKFAKAKVTHDGDGASFKLKKGKLDAQATIESLNTGGKDGAWEDPGCGDGCPEHAEQRTAKNRMAAVVVTSSGGDGEWVGDFSRIFKAALDDCIAGKVARAAPAAAAATGQVEVKPYPGPLPPEVQKFLASEYRPPSAGERLPRAAQLVDLNGDGTPEIVVFAGCNATDCFEAVFEKQGAAYQSRGATGCTQDEWPTWRPVAVRGSRWLAIQCGKTKWTFDEKTRAY